MSLSHKLATAAKLLVQLDFATMQRQLKINLARVEIDRHGNRPFAHHQPGFPFVTHPDWPDSANQFLEHSGDHWEFELIRQWAEPGDTVIDIGANLGLYTFAAAAQVGSAGRVLAVEAAPFVFEKLGESARLIGARQIEPVHAAVMERAGTATFYVRTDQSITGEQSLHPSSAQRETSMPVEVPAVTLKDLRRRCAATTVSVVKLDIEGAEAAALAAVPAEWLGADGPMWIVEINPGALARFGATPGDVTARFPADRFDCWLLPKHPLTPATKVKLLAFDHGRPPDWQGSLYYNFFCLPRGAGWQERRGRARRLLP